MVFDGRQEIVCNLQITRKFLIDLPRMIMIHDLQLIYLISLRTVVGKYQRLQ